MEFFLEMIRFVIGIVLIFLSFCIIGVGLFIEENLIISLFLSEFLLFIGIIILPIEKNDLSRGRFFALFNYCQCHAMFFWIEQTDFELI